MLLYVQFIRNYYNLYTIYTIFTTQQTSEIRMGVWGWEAKCSKNCGINPSGIQRGEVNTLLLLKTRKNVIPNSALASCILSLDIDWSIRE